MKVTFFFTPTKVGFQYPNIGYVTYHWDMQSCAVFPSYKMKDRNLYGHLHEFTFSKLLEGISQVYCKIKSAVKLQAHNFSRQLCFAGYLLTQNLLKPS